MPTTNIRNLPSQTAGGVPGAALGALFGTLGKLRRTKPLHPKGMVGSACLEVTDPQPELGVPLLAETGRHACLVRWSRAIGLPDRLPDFEGLAIRFEDPTADLLFASTGTRRVGRFVLLPRLPGRHGPQTTLLPVASRGGATVFAVTPVSPATGDGEPPARFEFSVAVGTSPWRAVGVMSVESWGADRPERFDPVRNALPGTSQYPVVRFLREPSYFLARSTPAGPRP